MKYVYQFFSSHSTRVDDRGKCHCTYLQEVLVEDIGKIAIEILTEKTNRTSTDTENLEAGYLPSFRNSWTLKNLIVPNITQSIAIEIKVPEIFLLVNSFGV